MYKRTDTVYYTVGPAVGVCIYTHMQIIYTQIRPQRILDAVKLNLADTHYTLVELALWEPVTCLTVYGSISDSKQTLLRMIVSGYTVDEQRIRDWLDY